VFAFACGLAVAFCGLISGDTIYGTGYAQVKAALENGSPLSADFGVLKFLATTFAAISGIPGGIFAPSLAISAGIGTNVASLFHGAPVAAITSPRDLWKGLSGPATRRRVGMSARRSAIALQHHSITAA
jgi:H+/Cl- antiporter ClcA